MPKKWTREERKKHLKSRYRKKREKLFALVMIAAIFIALVSLLSYGIGAGADPGFLIILAIIILILVPISIFFIESLTWEI